MTKWREYLIRSLKALEKDKYDFEDEKVFSDIEEEIQRYIDRLIFICYCEDKQIEDNELKPLLNVKRDKYFGKRFLVDQLRQLFKKYRDRYDSDLFKDGWCDKFEFHDHTIQEILEDLRNPVGSLPYDFSIIDADILGRAYESFLGHIMTGKTRFKEKDDIGKRKKHGIYYTPQYIVSYIVLNTIREKIKGKSFEEITKIKIVDPACGSGSFLIKAYDILVEESKINLKRDLNYDEKRMLLLNCIFGVDSDERACDIAKLNLSLKIATRGEKIPELHNNIKNGNSLIDDEKIAGDKAFNWESQFKSVFECGGFDVVIGNPPYGAELKDVEKTYLKKRFLGDKTGNTASFFIFLGNLILKNQGNMSFIVPKQLTYTSSWIGTRNLLLNENLKYVIDASEAFEDVELEQIIFVFNKQRKEDNKVVVGFSNSGRIIEDKSNIKYFDEQRFPLWITEGNHSIFEKILKDSSPLNNIAKVNWGGLVAKYLTKNKTADSISCIRGREIKRYHFTSEYFIKKKDIDESYYVKGEKLIFQRIVCRYGEKIIANYRNARMVGTYVNDNNYDDKTVTLIWDSKINLKFLLGFFNSRLINWFAHRYLWNRSQLTMEFMYEYARSFPIKIPDKKQEQRMVELVDQMLSLQKKLHESKLSGNEKERLEQQIKNIDYEIDQEVYKLYGITKAEQKIIEESLK